MQKYFWEMHENDENKIQILKKALGITKLTAKILHNRGITSPEEARLYLYGSPEEISSPFELPNMEIAAKTILASIEKKEKICVYGDYDADGITSTFVLSTMLKKANADVMTYIPNRIEEGYGLNLDAINVLATKNIKLIITVDCGIASINEISAARDMGINCVVTDHHTPPEILPKADAIVNPKLLPNKKETFDLAGVGVAWKTGWAVLERIIGKDNAWQEAFELLDIVAVGTIADMVTLLGENRIIVKYGLQKLQNTSNIGLQALIAEAGIIGKIDTLKVGFNIGPRLNAAGRMSNADKALLLLQESNVQFAKARAVHLCAENNTRQNIEKEILEEVEKLISEQTDPNDKILVLASSSWHEGVLGIVASKILEKKYQPVICLSVKNEEAKGSARSVTGFNIYEAIKSNSELLQKFGGHAMAAGLTLSAANIDAFRKAINAYANIHLKDECLISKKKIDTEILLSDITPEFINEYYLLEPFGQGNEKPIFMLRNGSLCYPKKMGKNNEHLIFEIKQNNQSMRGIAWGMAEKLAEINSQLDLIFTIQENNYQNQKNMQAVIIDARVSQNTKINIKKSIVIQKLVRAGKISWQEIENSDFGSLEKFFPNRNTLADVYRIIKKLFQNANEISEMQLREIAQKVQIPWETFYISLVIFYELGLLRINKSAKSISFVFENKQNEKIILENSPLYRQIKEEYNQLKEQC